MIRRETRTRNIALSLLAPNFLGFLIFTAGPVIFSLIMAFTNWDLTLHNRYSSAHIHFIGFDNFINLLKGDESIDFYRDLKNTLYLMIGIPVGIALSLVGAIMLDSDLRQARKPAYAITTIIVTLVGVMGMKLFGCPPLAICMIAITGALVLLGQIFGQTSFRTIYYLPNLTSGVAIFILWKAMYRPDTGPINNMLRPLLDGLTAAVTHTPSVLWTGFGYVFIIAAGVIVLWSLYTTTVALKDEETSVLGGLLTIIGVAALALAVYGIGKVIAGLPHMAAVAGGLQTPTWLSSPQWAKPALMLMGLFSAIGSGNMLMYLAALSNVPVELREAAEIDGASKWQVFRNVTWPQLAPTTFFIVIMSTIGGLQGGFDSAYVMTQGGPAGSTTTLAYYLYQKGFVDFQMGFASAAAWTMFLMIFVLTVINWKFGNTMVND